jgi:hypothetical protein
MKTEHSMPLKRIPRTEARWQRLHRIPSEKGPFRQR